MNRKANCYEIEADAAMQHAAAARSDQVKSGWLKVASAAYGTAHCLRLLEEHKRSLRGAGVNVTRS